MSNQIKPSVTNPTIADIYQDIESGRLILKPDFQRRFVWTHAHQEDFIDTILKGYPFPEIYVYQAEIDTKRLRTTQHVIDGQQRLTTLKKYIDDDYESDKSFKTIIKFSELSEDKRIDFLSYQIVVRDLGKVSEADIREIFRRINLTKFQLDDIEIHNAVYNGDFIKTAKEILENISLQEYEVFYESELTRMADLHFILLVMATLENQGYFPRDNEIENYIANYNEAYLNKDHIKTTLIKTFAVIKDIDLSVDSIWFRKSNFFTLIVEIANNLDKITIDIANNLKNLENNILANKTDSTADFGLYYSHMYSGTNSRKARVERAEIFRKYIFV